MSYSNPHMPLPMYTVNGDFQITDLNEAAVLQLASGSNLFDVIDTGSRRKVEKHLNNSETAESVEITVLSRSGDLLLADLYASWTDEQECEIVIVKQDQTILKVSEQLGRLRSRLTETNFELLEAKEEAEALLHQNTKLSSPFIELSDTVAIIPIFGALDAGKSENIALTITQRAYSSAVETIIIDFTAVGRIEQGGLDGFAKLVNMLDLLGFMIIVSGLHPNHVKEWNELEFSEDIRFMKTLRDAIERQAGSR
ncbi:hypothetical protein NCCP2716_22790 [Sporosarcina sp. NCCP-2716]|uniref:STAS domain-containing protein n=1 Tax=Sporosarcina sp. NCCP-2716 TaxID=2943679 RepID=UPI00203EB2E1|nr:STAS domain-containing protein [Sporosarcina sp. NCCP-2716]GKV69781.1 hypothetical protein NCCP2716_22790 [Sporosarcina sp. NCCP-2716]